MEQDEKRVIFEVSEPLTAIVNSFRLNDRQYQAIKRLAFEHGVTHADVIRQMIDFALKHMQDRP